MHTLPNAQPIADRLKQPNCTCRTPTDSMPVARRILRQVALAITLATASNAVRAEPMDFWSMTPFVGEAIQWPNDVMFANGKFWGVGTQGKAQHSIDGRLWTVVQTPNSRTLTSIVYDNGVYVAKGYAMTIMSSPDGTNWSIRYEDATRVGTSFSQIIFANGKFLAFGGDTGQVRMSSDGIDWTQQTKVSGIRFYPHHVTWLSRPAVFLSLTLAATSTATL